MTHASNINQEIAKMMAAVFGGNSRIRQYQDEEEKSQIAILQAADRPFSGITSYSTVGLSGWPIPNSQVRPPLGAEIVGACASDREEFGNLISAVAFFVINSGWITSPGVTFARIVGMHFPDTTVPHLMFVPPFLWEADLDSKVIGDRTVAWLLALPITSPELDYAQQYGSEALEERLEEAEIDIFDLQRSSAI